MRSHVPFDHKIAPLLLAKYDPIMEVGKFIKYFWLPRQKKGRKVHFCFLVLEHLAHPFFQHGFLLSGRCYAAEQEMPWLASWPCWPHLMVRKGRCELQQKLQCLTHFAFKCWHAEQNGWNYSVGAFTAR